MKKAVLIGIDYIDISGISLKGCINDVINMRNMLIDAYDYDPQNIIILRDDDAVKFLSPTYYNIYDSLLGLVLESSSLDEIWLHYSGHGSQLQKHNCNLEIKKEEIVEAIVPVDYLKAGCIVDCDLYDIIRRIKCKAILTFDCCHSGTICDMPWTTQYQEGTLVSTQINKLLINNKDIFVLSGCRDDQTSSDTTNLLDQRVGAFTNALCECLRKSHHNTSILSLHKDICIYLLEGGYGQIPVLSSTVEVPKYMFFKGEKKAAWSSSEDFEQLRDNKIRLTHKAGLLHQYVKKPELSIKNIASSFSVDSPEKAIYGESRFCATFCSTKPSDTSKSKKIRYDDETVIRGLLPFISSGFSISSGSSSETSSVNSVCRHFYKKR